MLDLAAVLMVVVVAVAYTWISKRQAEQQPRTTEGPPDHDTMPETRYVFPLEASELNASMYASAGRAVQVGAFGLGTV